VVAALSVAVALIGGTAYAAGAGRLPDPVQRQLHEALADMGVPAPGPRGTPPPASRPPSPSVSAATSAGASPGVARLLDLCRAWRADRANPGAPQLRPDDRRVLADAAGGPNRIDGFCAALAGTPAPSGAAPAVPTPGTATPGRPGNPNPGGPPATPPGKGNNGRNTGPPR
jgi:hypothetical protein